MFWQETWESCFLWLSLLLFIAFVCCRSCSKLTGVSYNAWTFLWYHYNAIMLFFAVVLRQDLTT